MPSEMGRRPRTDEPGAWHHVANRGARRHQTFYDTTDCQIFLHFLGEAKDRFELETHAFCLMGNHFHLLVHSPRGNLAAAMQMIGTNYTRRFNRRHGFDGKLFKNTYWSNRISHDRYLLEASRYIHRNPLDLGPTIDPLSYDWSSLKHYVGHRGSPAFLSTDLISRMVGGPDKYREFVRVRSTLDDEPYETAIAMLAGVPDMSTGELVIPTSSLHEIRLHDIDQCLAHLTDTPVRLVRSGGLGDAKLCRLVAITAAYELTAATGAAISHHYCFASTNSMATVVRRQATIIEGDEFAQLHHRLVSSVRRTHNRSGRP